MQVKNIPDKSVDFVSAAKITATDGTVYSSVSIRTLAVIWRCFGSASLVVKKTRNETDEKPLRLSKFGNVSSGRYFIMLKMKVFRLGETSIQLFFMVLVERTLEHNSSSFSSNTLRLIVIGNG